MLLLVPAQKSEEERSDKKKNHFSISPANSNHASSSSSSSPPTRGRVLVVLPPRTDMSSTLIVSDKTITTALTTTLHSCQHQQCGDLEQASDPTTRTYWPRHEDTMATKDAMAQRCWQKGSLPQTGNHCHPRRHSYFRSSVAEHCNIHWSTHPRSRSRTNRTASSFRQKSCSASTSTTTTTTTSSRSLSPHQPYSDSQRLLREAFKKTMTVQSPLLTSTSSGMVLDLTPGPAIESHWGSVDTARRSSSSLEAAAVANCPTDGERLSIRVSANNSAPSGHESSPDESSSSDRGTSMDMSDAEDKSLDKNDEKEEEEKDEENDGDKNNSDDLGTRVKVEAVDDERLLHSIANISQEEKGSSSKEGCTMAPANPAIDGSESTLHKGTLARSSLYARSKSTSSISSPFSSPVLPRMPTRPPSAPLPVLPGQDAVITAQDIALRTASLGALTPIEIQRRMYEHPHPKASSSRWPTRRRRSAGVSLEGHGKGESVSVLSSSLQTQPIPLQLRKQQASAACSVPDRIVSEGAAGGGRSGSENPNNLNGSFAPSLPSYYYLPPSAFRTAAAVAAEEQQEAERRRRNEQEQKETEENSFFEFPSPSPSPPSQASPSS